MSQRTPTPNTASGLTLGDRAALITRPARALIGWMDDAQALRALTEQRADASGRDVLLERVAQARKAVQDRTPYVHGSTGLAPVGEALRSHIDALRGSATAKAMFDEGWYVAMADLRTVVALQPHVFTDHAAERAEGIGATELERLATVSLPLPSQQQLPIQFDEARQTWLITAANPNLRIIGHFAGPVQEGLIGFGFAVGISPSYLQVAVVQGRPILRDGYHRAHGFLRTGITHVPVFAREYQAYEDLGMPAGMLPAATYLGERPPMLADYLDDSVTAEVRLPASQKMVVVHGMELTPIA